MRFAVREVGRVRGPNESTRPAPEKTTPARQRKARGGGGALLAVTVAAIVAAGVGAFLWLLQSTDSDKSSSATISGQTNLGAQGATGTATVPPVAAKIVSASRLRTLAAASGRSVYWAGPRHGARVEYTRTSDGSRYVRYLTGGAKAGARGAGYIVVATYSQPNAYKRVSAIARRKHMFVADLAGGGIAVTKPGRPQNIYVLYPGRPYQIEVYAPDAATARRLVFGGAIQPVK